MCVCYQGQCPQRPEGDVSFPGTGVTSGCELQCMGTGNKAMILCKTSKCSSPLSHFPFPISVSFDICKALCVPFLSFKIK